MRRLGALPLAHQPGERWLYHTGVEVAGVLIARAAGTPLDQLLHERIFAPLGMRDTSFSVPAANQERLAHLLPARRRGQARGVGRPPHRQVVASATVHGGRRAGWAGIDGG
jgi:CubicO group peptidase (beta-lactamase class C family)